MAAGVSHTISPPFNPWPSLIPSSYLLPPPPLLAVVTGATDGIGKAIAFELAKKGLNIFLISRSIDKLQQTQEELKKKYPNIEVRILSVDYSQFDAKARESVTNAVAGLDIGVLINNVGMSYPFTKYFHELTDEQVGQLMALNVESTTWMTKIIVAGMVERKRGAIVNLGSGKDNDKPPISTLNPLL